MTKTVSRPTLLLSSLLLGAMLAQPAAATMASEFRDGVRVLQASPTDDAVAQPNTFKRASRNNLGPGAQGFRNKPFSQRSLSTGSFRRAPSSARQFSREFR